jgi:hypothetical protein
MLNTPLRFPNVRKAIAGREEWALIGLGILFRVAEYAWDRPYWQDEGSLAANIKDQTFASLFGPLTNTQLAPPGFLAVEWLAAHVLGTGREALRLFPLLAAVASLFLFRKVAARCLNGPAAVIGLALFAFSDDLIYFGSELKQYSCDVACCLACYLAAFAAEAPIVSVRRWFGLAAFAAIVVWFSHPAVFVIGGIGLALVGSALRTRAWRRAVGLSLMGLVAAGSVAAVYAVSQRQLGYRRGMWVFWGFAFPPEHPSSVWDLTWALRRFVYLFVNPLSFNTPLGPRLSVIIPCALFCVGVASLWNRERLVLAMLALPVLLTLLVAFLRLYPFHGRLLLFLVPVLLLFIAEGAGRVPRGRARWVILTAVFLVPVITAVDHVIEGRESRFFHPHGDLRPTTLDSTRFP